MKVPTECCGSSMWWEYIIGNIYEAKCPKCETGYLRKGDLYYIKKKGETQYKCPVCGTEMVEASVPHPYRPSYSVFVPYCPKCEPKPEKA